MIHDLILMVVIAWALAGLTYGAMRLVGIGQCAACSRLCSIFELHCRGHRQPDDSLDSYY